MFEALRLISEMKDITDKAESLFKERVKQLSAIDKKLSELYHNVEGSENKNSVEGYKIYKQLRDILRERRIIKHEIAILESWLSMQGKNFRDITKQITKSTVKFEQNYEEWTKNWTESDFKLIDDIV